MREILFKAKRIDNGEWVYGSYVYTFREDENCPVTCVQVEKHFIVEESGNMFWVDEDPICQYTGLADKNGQKIWENDVVRIGGHISEVNDIYKIIFDEISHCLALERSVLYRKSYFTFSCLNGFAEDCEVIGSIFDNPELLSE